MLVVVVFAKSIWKLRGAGLFARGCFKAIRNSAQHKTEDWNPLTAFEYLAALSIVARWVELTWVDGSISPSALRRYHLKA